MPGTPTASLLSALLAAWRATENPGHSDLDNEQPISLHVVCTLGDLRALALASPQTPPERT